MMVSELSTPSVQLGASLWAAEASVLQRCLTEVQRQCYCEYGALPEWKSRSVLTESCCSVPLPTRNPTGTTPLLNSGLGSGKPTKPASCTVRNRHVRSQSEKYGLLNICSARCYSRGHETLHIQTHFPQETGILSQADVRPSDVPQCNMLKNEHVNCTSVTPTLICLHPPFCVTQYSTICIRSGISVPFGNPCIFCTSTVGRNVPSESICNIKHVARHRT